MRLFGNALSGNTYKIRLLCAQLGIECAFVPVDIFQGESRTPDFQARNPIGQTPVLELADGRNLAESNAILTFLAEGSPLYPSEPFQRAEVLAWMFFEQNQVMPNIAWARFIRRFLPDDHAMRARLPVLDEGGRMALAVLERVLSDRPFATGNAYTLADIALYGYGHTAPEADIDLAVYPQVRAWLERIAAQPRHVTMAAAYADAA